MRAACLGLLFLFAVACRSPPGHTERPAAEPGVEPPSAARTSAPFDGGAIIRRVHFSYRPDGQGFLASHSTHSVRVSQTGELGFAPARVDRKSARPAGPKPSLERVEAQPFRVDAVFLARGRERLTAGVGRPGVREDGSLLVSRGGVDEILENTEQGVEQSFRFRGAPRGSGDLTVRLKISGQRFLGETSGGLHFGDTATGLGVRYGAATWVDARGARTPVRPRYDGGEIVLTVPAAVLEHSEYPAVLDPIISGELGMDTPITSPGYDSQTHPSVAYDGTNFLVVWSDRRAGSPDSDIYGARVSASGVVQDALGIRLSPGTGTADLPAVAFDGTNYFVVWQDTRGGVGKIQGTRVSTAGTVLDPINVAVSASSVVSNQVTPAIAFDGTNYFVVWQDNRSFSPYNVYAARVTPAMSVLDPDGIAVSTGSSSNSGFVQSSNAPAVAAGSGSVLVAWEATPTGFVHSGLFAARVSSAGVVLDHPGLVVASDASRDELQPAVASNGTDFLVAWQESDSKSGFISVHGRRVSSAGALLDASFFLLSSKTGLATLPTLGFDGTNYLAVWAESRGGSNLYLLYASRVTPAGAVLDSAGVALTSIAPQLRPVLAFGGGQYLLAFEDGLNDTGPDIYAERVSTAPARLDNPQFVVSQTGNGQVNPEVVFDGTNYFIVWEDYRGGNVSVYGARVTPSGTVLDPSGIALAASPLGGLSPAVAYDGASTYLVVYTGGGTFIRGVRVSKAGVVLDSPALDIATGTFGVGSSAVAFSGSAFLVVWLQKTSLSSPPLFSVSGARVSSAGKVLDSPALSLTSGNVSRDTPAVSGTAAGWLVVWTDSRSSNSTGNDIYGARVDTDGGVLDTSGIAICDAGSTQSNPKVVFDGTNSVVVWADRRHDGSTSQIYGARVDSTGAVLDPGGQLFVSGPASQDNPAIAFDGLKYLLAWTDARGPSGSDLYMAWIQTDGGMRDPEGFPLSVTGYRESAPALATDSPMHFLVAYNRVDPAAPYTSQRVRARRVDLSPAPRGLPCVENPDCTSGFCANGVCCDTACNGGACQACSVAAGAPSDGTCALVAAKVVCRPPAGPCDVAERCDGLNPTCPPDGFQPATIVCRPDAGLCDVAETCPGTGPSCPADSFLPAGTVCRPDAGACDVAETCSGTGPSCPVDTFLPTGVLCRPDAGACDVAESCTGTSAACPPDSLLGVGTVCRPSAGSCDFAESCTGTSAACPPDSVITADGGTGVCQCTTGGSSCKPAIVHDASLKAALGQSYLYNFVGAVNATGAAVLTYGRCGGPAEFTVEPNSGAVHWTPAASGAIPLCVSVQSAYGSDQYAFTVNVGVRQPTPVTAVLGAQPVTGSAPLTVSFDGSRSSADPSALPLSFRWDFGDGSPPGSGSPESYVYRVPGSYPVRLTAFDAYGAPGAATGRIDVLRAPGGGAPPHARIVASQTHGQDSLAVSFSCDCQPGGAALAAYQWDLGNGTVVQTPGASASYGPGRYHVALRVVDVAGLPAWDSVEIDVTQGGREPPACSAGVEPSAGPAPLGVSWKGSFASTGGPVTAYRWELPGPEILPQVWVARRYAQPGAVTGRFVVQDDVGLTCSAQATVTVLGTAGDVPPRIVSAPASGASCGAPYVYSATGGPVATGTPPLSWALDGAPPDAQVDPATGVLTWRPRSGQAATQHFALTVRNAAGSDRQEFDVQVVCLPAPRLSVGCGCRASGEGSWGVALAACALLGLRRRRSPRRTAE